MPLKVTNNAFGTLNAGISNSDTIIVLEAGQGARFPVLGAGDYFYATLIDTSNQLEIVKVTARATDTMTVVRAQDGTTARAYNVNDRFELRPTAALFNEKADAADVTAELATKQAASPVLTTYAATGVGMRNRIINGGMVIDQRNNGASVNLISGGGNGYAADRWYAENNTDGTATVQQITDAPAGFSNSLRYTVTATDSSLASDQSAFVQQRVEGFNSADLAYGTAGAVSVTVSFWVKSSVTGTFGGALANSAYNRGYSFTYTISVANTWEQKTVTITGDTSGTWVGSTNGIGLRLSFALAAGSARASTAGAWASYVGIGATGATNLMATSGATFQITGCQLEAGSVATPFERRPYGAELALCQRYYQTYAQPPLRGAFVSSSAASRCGMALPVVMRASPTAVVGALPLFDGSAISTVSSIVNSYLRTSAVEFDFGTATSLTAGRPAIVYQEGTSTMTLSAEL